jgi:hypothetical protein
MSFIKILKALLVFADYFKTTSELLSDLYAKLKKIILKNKGINHS